MKKFLTKIMFAAVAVLSVAGFTSCNNADDDPYVPAQASVQEQPKYEEIPSYVAFLSGDILDLYDVTLVLHNGGQTKEVELTKANGEIKDDLTFYYLFSDVNGQKGVTSVEAKVTPKADAKTLLESMPEDKVNAMIYGGRLFKGSYDANGKLVNDMKRVIPPVVSGDFVGEMLVDMGDGTLIYEHEAKTIEMYLTR